MGSSTEHSAFGPDGQPVGPRAGPGRLVSGGSAAAVAAFHAPLAHRHRHGRLDPPAGRAVRRRRDEADLRPRQPLRDRGVREQPRPDRAVRARRSRRRGAAARDRRPRRARLHLGADRRPRRPGQPAGLGRRGGVVAARAAVRAADRVLPRRAWSRASRRASARPSRRSRRPGATVEEVSLPHTDYGLATYYIVAPAEASANLARYDGVRYGFSVRGGDDYLADYLATRGQGFGAEVKRRIMLGTYALSAGYYDAFYLKAQKVRTLIKRDFDRLWEQGFDALVAPTSRDRRVPVRRPDGRPGADVPVRRVHAAGEHGRAARRVRSRAACPRACPSASSSSAPPGPRPSCSARRGPTRASRPTRPGGRWSPRTSRRSTTPPCRRPPSAPAWPRRTPETTLGAATRIAYPSPTMTDLETARAPLAERALAAARPCRAAVGDPPVLRHPRHDGRRHQPRGGGARLRHARARSSRRASRACARAGPTTRRTSAPSSSGGRCPTTSSACTASATTRRPRSWSPSARPRPSTSRFGRPATRATR